MSIEPTPYQQLCMAVPPDKNLLMCGGRGGGKSYALLLILLREVLELGENARPLVIRETYKSLAELADKIVSMLITTFGRDGVKFNKQEGVIRCSNGAQIELGQLSDSQSYHKYQGRSYTSTYIDDAGLIRDMRWVKMLTSNLRGPKGVPLRQIMSANPGGPGHGTLHSDHVARSAAWVPYTAEDGQLWVNAPSTMYDNPTIDHEDYKKRLEASVSGDTDLLRAWLTGDWNIARGAMWAGLIGDFMTLPPAWPYPVTKAEKPFISMDWGLAAPMVALQCLIATGEEGFPRNSILVIDETCSNDPADIARGLSWPPSFAAEAIKDMCLRYGIKSPHGVGDDAFGFDENLLSILRTEGLYLNRPEKGRATGWAAMRQRLTNAKEKNGKPGLYVSSRCAMWFRTVPFLQRDKIRWDDADTAGNDHHADATRYACMEVPLNTNTSIEVTSPLGSYNTGIDHTSEYKPYEYPSYEAMRTR